MNPVFNYLNANKGVKLSVKTLAHRLDIRRGTALYFATRGNVIRRVGPMEVGNLGSFLNVFTIDP